MNGRFAALPIGWIFAVVVASFAVACGDSAAMTPPQTMTPTEGAAGFAATSGTGAAGTPATGGAGSTSTQATAGASGAGRGASGSAAGSGGNAGAVGPTAGASTPPAAGATAPSEGGAGDGEGAAGMNGAAGVGGTAGEGAAGAAGDGGAAGMKAVMDHGKGDGKDVVTIGDSWMSYALNGGGIESALDRSMTNYRHYAVAGTQLLNGQIPGQYDRAKREDPMISTVILTGGGNDIMFSGGCNTKQACEMSAQRIADGLDELYTKMAADGVKSVVYIQYSRNAGTAPAETRPDKPAIPAICLTDKIQCLSVSTTELIAAGDTVDGIHPTRAGCDRIAKATLDVMTMAGARR